MAVSEIQQAIQYMEDHLLEDITSEAAGSALPARPCRKAAFLL